MAVAHKSVISFGLVSIPIGMYTATQRIPLENGALNQSVYSCEYRFQNVRLITFDYINLQSFRMPSIGSQIDSEGFSV